MDRGFGYAISAVLLWSTVASAFKIALSEMSISALIFYSSSFSTLILLISVILQGKLSKEIFSAKNLRRSLLFGALNPFLYYNLLFLSYSLLPAQEAQGINFSWPVILALLSPTMLKQKISMRSMIAVVVSFSGVVVISIRTVSLSGALVALSSAFVWAIYWLGNTRDDVEQNVRLFLNFLFGSLFASIPFLFEFEPPSLSAFYIGAFEMGITFILWQKALKLSGNAARTANLVYLTPFISLIFIHGILGEEIKLRTVAGLILILSGILLQARTKMEIKKDK